jgi:spermidine/putrescine transport system substrate-binding protein
MQKSYFQLGLWMLFLFLIAGCQPSKTPTPELAKEITYYDWEGDMPQSVLDAFTKEYGVKVNYVTFESMEEAVQSITDGKVYDVVNMETKYLPNLIKTNLLAKLNHAILTNFKNISPDFRDLTFDPENLYSIPNSWGAAGILVQSDKVDQPITRWSDLWRPDLAGKVAVYRGEQRDVIGLTLRSLGYSANSEDPVELQKAEDQLIALKPNVLFSEDYDPVSVAPLFISGRVVAAMGYAYDFHSMNEENPAIMFVYPEDGSLLWNDNYVIPAKSSNQYTAQVFLNFLMRPEIAALAVNEVFYAKPIEGAKQLVNPDIRDDPVVYPPTENLENAEIIFPISEQAEKRYAEIWEKFTRSGEQP